MSKPKIRWRLAGFEEIRRLPKTKATLKSSADRIAAASGEGFEALEGEGRTRSRASVVTTSVEAINSNRKNNTLLRNMDAGKL